jgi:hypothetical protein
VNPSQYWFFPNSGMNDKIMNEVRSTIEDIKKRTLGGDKILCKVDSYFDLPDLNVIWGLLAGTRQFLTLLFRIFVLKIYLPWLNQKS